MVDWYVFSKIYQNPDDLPPGGFRTLIVARGPLESNSSEKLIIKKFNEKNLMKKESKRKTESKLILSIIFHMELLCIPLIENVEFCRLR